MKKLIVLVITIIIPLAGFSQNIDIIRNLAKQVQAGQISQQEAIQRARDAGMSQSQIEQARERISNAREARVSEMDRAAAPQYGRQADTIPDSLRVDRQRRDSLRRDTIKKYFGYELFQGPRDKYDRADIGSLDPNYQIGPGDELIISIWGATEMRNKYQVSRDGTIFIERYGQMIVSGLTMKQLEDKLTKNLSKIYSGLSPGEGSPNTYLDVSLGKLRSIQVFIIGKVKNAGSHFVNSYSTAFTALYQSGGPTIKGSLRDIRVIRNGEVVSSLDLYDFITTGKKPNDIRLQNNDVVYVPPRHSTIKLKGEVKEKAFFELRKEENLQDLIKYSGGLPTTADIQNVQIERIHSFKERERTGEIYEVLAKDLGTFKKDSFQINPIAIHDKDVVTIFPVTGDHVQDTIPGGVEYVNVNGHIYKPGRYILSEEMKVKDLLRRAGGLKDSVFWDQTYKVRADLIRYTENGLDRKIKSIPLNDLLKNDSLQYNYTLQHRDSLIVYDAGVTHKPGRVTIQGEVEEPGTYVLEKNMGIHDLLLQAGGFTKLAYKYNVEVFRIGRGDQENRISRVYNININPDILKNFRSKPQIELQDFDMVVVRKDPDFEYHKVVKLEGEVQFPGRYPILRESETLGQVIQRAGGLTQEAFLPGLKFTRNDTSKVVGDFARVLEGEDGGIILQQGDSIYVPQHPGTVKVTGSVRNPGVVQYHPGWGLERYVEAAGDYTFEAAKSKTIVYYPGGNARRKHWYRKPEVKEGSEIFVPRKPEREPLDVTQLLTEWASIATSVATVIYIINRN